MSNIDYLVTVSRLLELVSRFIEHRKKGVGNREKSGGGGGRMDVCLRVTWKYSDGMKVGDHERTCQSRESTGVGLLPESVRPSTFTMVGYELTLRRSKCVDALLNVTVLLLQKILDVFEVLGDRRCCNEATDLLQVVLRLPALLSDIGSNADRVSPDLITELEINQKPLVFVQEQDIWPTNVLVHIPLLMDGL